MHLELGLLAQLGSFSPTEPVLRTVGYQKTARASASACWFAVRCCASGSSFCSRRRRGSYCGEDCDGVWGELDFGRSNIGDWLLRLRLGVSRLKAVRPVPMAIEQLQHDAEVANLNGGMIMGRHSEQLERETEECRDRLAGSLEELRLRISPGQVVDQIADYAREGPVADFARNLVREIRDNPAPLLLIAAGVAWWVAATSRSSRSRTIIERERKAEITSPPDASRIKVASAGKTAIQRPQVLTPAGA
jgi:hypothetical protein